MNEGVLSYVTALFTNSWNMLETVNYPGTNLSLAVILLGSFLVVFSMRLIGNVFGFSSGSGQSGGNNRKIKVNKNREDDTH